MKLNSNIREINDQLLFNKISDKYAEKDEYIPSALARKHQVDCMLKMVDKQKYNILEVGCGHGANAIYLKEYYSNYLGIDYAQKLITIANHRYQNQNTKYQCTNIKDFDNYKSFNLIVGVGILHHVTDLDEFLAQLKSSLTGGTQLIFIEPQSGNPLLQFMRYIRGITDKNYSREQVFFKKNELIDAFYRANFNNIKTRYQGYLSTPFAQVIIKPKFLFLLLSRITIAVDSFLFNKISNRFAWNIIIKTEV